MFDGVGEMSKRKVVVTGIGVVAAPGVGVDDLWKGLQQPPPAPGPRIVADWDPEPWLPRREHRRLDRFTQFALVAAHEALEHSGELEVDPNRVMVSVATGIGGLESLEELVHVSDGDDPRASPFLVPMMMANAAAAGISRAGMASRKVSRKKNAAARPITLTLKSPETSQTIGFVPVPLGVSGCLVVVAISALIACGPYRARGVRKPLLRRSV